MAVPMLGGVTGSTGIEARRLGRAINPIKLEQIRIALTAFLQGMNDPAIRNLKDVLENNEWHKGSVLDHTLAVATAFRELLEVSFINDPIVTDRLSRHLDAVVDPTSKNKYSRAELAYLATFLHDIGKGMVHPKDGQQIARPKVNQKTNTVEPNADGTPKTTALYHDSVGAQKAFELVMQKFDCSEKEAAFIQDIITNHMAGFFLESSLADHETIIQQAKNDKERAKLQNARDNLVPDFLKKIGYNPLIMLHTMADLMGSEGHQSPAETGFYPGLISAVFKLPRYSKIEDLENQVKAGKTILVPGSNLVEPQVRAGITADINDRVKAGKVPADKAAAIIESRVQKVMPAIKYMPGIVSADQAEEAFYTNPESKLGQAVIFDSVPTAQI
jgi:hypothetical protein